MRKRFSCAGVKVKCVCAERLKKTGKWEIRRGQFPRMVVKVKCVCAERLKK